MKAVVPALLTLALLADGPPQPPPFSVSGVVVTEAGERLRPVRAIARPEEKSGVTATTWSADREGRFTILNLPAGSYRVFLEATPFATLEGRPVRHFAGVPVRVDGDVLDLVLVAHPGVTLTGTLVFHGPGRRPPLRNIWVAAVGIDGRTSTLGMVGDDGRFELTEVFGRVRIGLSNLPRGYTLRAVKLGEADITGELVEITAGERRELRLELEPARGPKADEAGADEELKAERP
jgi:hypothetical protein